MGEGDYFKNALSNFTYDVACGGAIRHKADMGDTVRKIVDELDFPMPYEKVQQTVWKHFVETSVILLEEPGTGKESERYQFVKEQNKYGTTSFRRIKVTGDAGKVIDWKTKTFSAQAKDEIIKQLEDKLSGNPVHICLVISGASNTRMPGSITKSYRPLTKGRESISRGFRGNLADAIISWMSA